MDFGVFLGVRWLWGCHVPTNFDVRTLVGVSVKVWIKAVDGCNRGRSRS